MIHHQLPFRSESYTLAYFEGNHQTAECATYHSGMLEGGKWMSILNALRHQSLIGEYPQKPAVKQHSMHHSVYTRVLCRSRYLQLLLWGAQALTMV